MTEVELEMRVLEAQSGATGALGDLYEYFCTPMHRYALLRVGDPMVAEDLVQNVWINVSRRLGKLRDVSLFRSWLYRALKWEITDWQRRKSREVLTPDVADTALGEVSLAEHTVALPLLKTLANNERDIAELYYLNDFSVREIGLTLGLAEGTVKSRLHRARGLLRDGIERQNQRIKP